MKKIGWIALIALLGLGLSGCCCMHKSCKGGPGMGGQAMCQKCGGTGAQCKCPSGQKQMAEINTAALKALLDAGVALTVLDARAGKSDDGRRIPGAQSLAPDAKDEDILAKLKSKDALIVTYCANLKCPASRALADKLRKLGYTRVLEYPYGIEGWADAGNPIAQPAK